MNTRNRRVGTRLAGALLAPALVALAVACSGGGQATTPTPETPVPQSSPTQPSLPSPTREPSPIPARPIESQEPSTTPGMAAAQATLEKVDRLLKGQLVPPLDIFESSLGELSLPVVAASLPEGGFTGLNAAFDWEFVPPPLELEAPTVSAENLSPAFGGRP